MNEAISKIVEHEVAETTQRGSSVTRCTPIARSEKVPSLRLSVFYVEVIKKQ